MRFVRGWTLALMAALLLSLMAAPALASNGREDAGPSDSAVAAQDQARDHAQDQAQDGTCTELDDDVVLEPDQDRLRTRDQSQDQLQDGSCYLDCEPVRDRDMLQDGDMPDGAALTQARTRVCDGEGVCVSDEAYAMQKMAWRFIHTYRWEKLFQFMNQLTET